jgi:hypothetical protein
LAIWVRKDVIFATARPTNEPHGAPFPSHIGRPFFGLKRRERDLTEDIVAERFYPAEHIVDFSDVPPRLEFVGVEGLHVHPMAGRSAGRKVPTGHVSCERMVAIAPKQVNKHHGLKLLGEIRKFNTHTFGVR